MTKRHIGNLSTLIVFFFAVAAIGGPLKPPTPPNRSVLEATGHKSQFQLRLKVRSSEIALGSHLWFRLSLKNVSARPVMASNGVFLNPLALSSKSGGYVLVAAPDGREAVYLNGMAQPWSCPPELTEVPIDSVTLAAYHKAASPSAYDPSPSSVRLQPGEEISTPAWAAPGWENCKQVHRVSEGDFTELWNVVFDKPGKYRVRGVYDTSIPKDLAKKYGIRQGPDELRVETSWIDITVR